MLLKELFVSLGLEVDEAAFAKGQLAASLVEAGIKKVVEVGKELIASFAENAKEAIEYGDHIRKTSQQIGIATEALQELQYAGKLSGVSAEEMTASVRILSRNMNAAKGGAEEQAQAFHKLGVKVTDAQGKLRSADEVMADVAEKFGPGGMPDGAQKTALAMQVFGRAGARLIPMLNEGKEGIEELRKEAQELGLVMGEDSTKTAEELGDNLERLHLVTKGLWRQAIEPLLPALNELVLRFLQWKKANAEITKQRIQAVMKGLIKVVTYLAEAFEFLVKNATMIKTILGVAGVTGVIITLAQKMAMLSAASVAAAARAAASWLLAAAPFIAIGAIITGLLLVFDDIRTYQEGGDSLYGRFKKEIDSWLEPKTDDVWWLSALKYFVRLMKDAIEVLLQFNELTNMTDANRAKTLADIDRRTALNKGQMQQQQDRYQLETARKQAAAGVPLSDASRAALARAGVNEQTFVARYRGGEKPAAPTAPAATVPPSALGASSTSSSSYSAPMQIQIVQQPGQSSEELANIVADHVDRRMQSVASDAVASVPE